MNSLIVPKYIKGETLWAFWHFSLLQNIKKKLEGGTFEVIKNSKSHRGPKKNESRTVPKKIARKSFWLMQGLEPVTAGFTVNRINSVLKSGTYTMRSVVGRKKKEKT